MATRHRRDVMSSGMKVIPDKFREVVGLRSNVDVHLTRICRSRRRAVWSGVAHLLKRGLFGAKAMLSPHVHLSVGGSVHVFGALNLGGCVTVVGISHRKLILYSVIDRIRLLRRAGEANYCTILDEEFQSPSEQARVRVWVLEYKYMIWSAWRYFVQGVKERWGQFLEFLPGAFDSPWPHDTVQW
jgi:hypothetical protein